MNNKGLCVQILHIGSYSDKLKSLNKIQNYIESNGLISEIGETRKHHEIYLSDLRKTKPEKLKTVLRILIKNYKEESKTKETCYYYSNKHHNC